MTWRLSLILLTCVLWMPQAMAQLCGITGAVTETYAGQGCYPSPDSIRYTLAGNCSFNCGLPSTQFSLSHTLVQQCTPTICRISLLTPAAPQQLSNGQWRITATLERKSGPACSPESPVVLRATCTPCPSCTGGGAPNPQNNTGTGDDPLLISVVDDEYPLSSFEDGVKFDLDLDGRTGTHRLDAGKSG